MDAPRFDRFAKILAAPRNRRGALASLLGGALCLRFINDSESPNAVARKKTRQRKRRQESEVLAQGPCGNGGPRHNACKRHRQCCTGYCEHKKRCRCRRPGDPCTEDRNCCPDHHRATCQEGVCRLPDGGGECTPGATRSCYNGPAGTENTGECRPGVQTCSAGQTWGACAGEVLPQVETCNGRDDDCDGVIDNGFACPNPPNATGVCASGVCQITCNAGFASCDGNLANGCEVNLQTDPHNCGACGRDCGIVCDGTPTTPPCRNGRCLCGSAG